MENVISKAGIRREIRKNLPETNMQVSSAAVDYFVEYFEAEMEKVIREAAKSNYTVVKERDVRRGIKRERARMVKKMFDALDWSLQEFYKVKHELEQQFEEGF
ncbi:MAG: hypothetical protein B6U72_03010 [Candidatus Altiarchaeales archaeon ex4484_2]|nr:MAG: hypothetical protein B6U72_03010 [Candidatus Altiarchaeales archaeon ex4484_2]